MHQFIKNINVSNETILELGKFSILWAKFELEYCNNQCSDKLFFNNKIFLNSSKNVNDKNTITARNNFRNYCNFKLNFKELSHNLIDSLLNYFNQTKETITPKIIHESLYSKNFKCYYTQVDDIICNNITNNEELLLGSLLIIFRLRNNLFHGLKDCYSINNQIHIFKNCNCFLDFLLNN